MADELTKAGYTGGQINEYNDLDQLRGEQGVVDSEYEKIKKDGYNFENDSARINSMQRGIKDEKSMDGSLVNSNPAWPNMKKGN